MHRFLKEDTVLENNSFFRRTMAIAIPVAIQVLLQSSFSIIDQIMVGKLGENAIAAVEVGGKPGFVFVFVSGAVATVAGIMISQYIGKEEEEKVHSSLSVNLLVMLVIALLTSLMCMLIPTQVVGIFTEDGFPPLTSKGIERSASEYKRKRRRLHRPCDNQWDVWMTLPGRQYPITNEAWRERRRPYELEREQRYYKSLFKRTTP